MRNITVAIIDVDSDMVLVYRYIKIPDEGFINEHVRARFSEADYDIVKIYTSKNNVCSVYIRPHDDQFV